MLGAAMPFNLLYYKPDLARRKGKGAPRQTLSVIPYYYLRFPPNLFSHAPTFMQARGVVAWSESNYQTFCDLKCTVVKTFLTRGSGNHRLLTSVSYIACRGAVAGGEEGRLGGEGGW